MSFGKKSSLYRPVSTEMIASLCASFPSIPEQVVQEAVHAMTDRISTETLLACAWLSMLNHALGGASYGTSIKLSALLHDGSGKAQTALMELLHDVVVELPMSTRLARKLDSILAVHGLAYVSYHSCGSEIMDAARVDQWLEQKAAEEMLRTELDWNGEMLKAVSEADIIHMAYITEAELSEQRRIESAALSALQCFRVSVGR